ncbi:YeiH family protein [Histidinibacterium aquaticum]|uniref:Putative sulfate exporter family transporter n=1 Tax=Histidinibacterium aquaticum TaxID=2613962 RepID=A0A5J5GL44_9RHOB|nr:putative sulfate exporter family transporter [Histidinibacterium aquaticum]KAA9009046.1 putative sulfate exporter family transporter [Histidinibacterium aquaticum]
MSAETETTPRLRRLKGRAEALFPGLMVAALIALAASFVSEHYGAPAMLLALLFGIALNFLADEPRCAAGIAFAAKGVLRAGVALLGLRITAGMVMDLGAAMLALVVLGVASTIGFGFLVARAFGFRNRFAMLSAGAVAICGASAAMAISAALPPDERTRQRLAFTVVGVTLLSTVAMVIYPVIASALAFDDRTAGIYIGATIHDVAQVVGAGFSISEEAGETATLVKLIRVAMLAPVVLLVSAASRRSMEAGKRPPLLPGFVLAFVGFAALASFGLVPQAVSDLAGGASRALLLMAIGAVGVATSLKEVVEVGPRAMGMLVSETVFLAVLIALGLTLF